MSEAEAAAQPPNLGELIALYLDTRDARDKLVRQQKDAVKNYNDMLTLVEGRLMEHLQKNDTQSVSSDVGTAYLSRKRSATIGDAEAFRGHVIENRAWDLCDWKANVTAVDEFLAEHGVLPPGVNFRTVVSVNVQKK